MSKPVRDPGGRDDHTTTPDVAALLTALVLPPIEPFTSDSPLLRGLPDVNPVPVPDPEPLSRALVARSVYDDATLALAALKRLEDATAACRASLVSRLMGAAGVEARALSMDSWQRDLHDQSARTELAAILTIPEGTAATLAHHATELTAMHPATFAALESGVLSWRHVGIVIDEHGTLANTPGITAEDLADLEVRLLRMAPHTTAAAFRAKARRLRESTHPESLAARTQQAMLARSVTLDPGQDGMSWLTLHLPAPAAEGVWVHCTRLARSLDGPHEHRTLAQRRADVAASLLLGQHTLPELCSAACSDPVPAGTRVATPTGGSSTGTRVATPGVEDAPTPAAAAIPGFEDGLVDGMVEDPERDYLNMLAATRAGTTITEPPLPVAQILLTVPVLGALGITAEPAELAGHGPISLSIARRLLADTPSFLRVLTDPISNDPLPLQPDRYWVRDAERAVLRAMAGNCYFPNCPHPVIDTDLDHLQPWEHGGSSTWENLRPACARHHALKHLRDDKDRHGHYRYDTEPDRAGIALRGWHPVTEADGRVGWRSPSGRYFPPVAGTEHRTNYPEWLKSLMDLILHSDPATRPAVAQLGDLLVAAFLLHHRGGPQSAPSPD